MTDLKLLFVNAVMFALLLATSGESLSATGAAQSPSVMVGVSLQIVDACGVVSQAGSVLARCRSAVTRADSSMTGSPITPVLVTEQWCPRDKLADTGQESVCSEVRTPDSDRLLVFTF